SAERYQLRPEGLRREIFLRICLEFLRAAFRAEVVRRAGVLNGRRGALGRDLHAAHRVGLSFRPRRASVLRDVVMMLHSFMNPGARRSPRSPPWAGFGSQPRTTVVDSRQPRRDSSAALSHMTTLDVMFRYGVPPDEPQMRALDGVREVYGVRRLVFDEQRRTIRVEFDASRLSADSIAALLRGAGVDLRERVALV